MAIDGSFVWSIYELGFADHDLHDDKQFPNFNPKYYMWVVLVEQNKPPALQFQQWALGFETSKINNLLDIPHFG